MLYANKKHSALYEQSAFSPFKIMLFCTDFYLKFLIVHKYAVLDAFQIVFHAQRLYLHFVLSSNKVSLYFFENELETATALTLEVECFHTAVQVI